jgi:hypothetical protein
VSDGTRYRPISANICPPRGTGHVGGWNRYAAWHLDAVVEVDGVLKKTRNNKGKETKTWHVEGIANSCDDFKRKSREWEDSE